MRVFVILSLFIGLLFATVDINTGSVDELGKLKGIGMKKANDILEYRKTNCFKSIDELVNVKGIGKKTLEKNRSEITVSECKK